MRTNHKDPSPESQSKQILQYLMLGCKLNAMQALKMFGTMKLSSRLTEIRRDYKVKIQKERIKGTNYMRYWIDNPKHLAK